MKTIFNKSMHLHFVGIGGIGMSGMAELLYNHGFKISGSDINNNNRVKQLSKKNGIKIYLSHNRKNITNSDVIIYSSAIKNDNPELKEGKIKKIPIIRRAELLGELLKVKEISVAVAGTHGKTTTSSMFGNILYEANLDPTLVIGGIVNKYNSNNISGSGNIIVVEADEFDRSFLSLSSTYSIINNLDPEHLDCYKNIDDLLDTFTKFANSIPFYGKTAINIDSKNLRLITKNINRPIKTFAIDRSADIIAENISYNNNESKFKVIIKGKKTFEIKITVPGKHNIYNALGAISIAEELKIPIKNIKLGLKNYSGVKRRFEISHIDKNRDIMIVDDYAHHPNEISETIKAAKNGWNKRIVSIFQPHLFSRTRDFYKDFAKSLNHADVRIITDIYPAREKPIKGVSSKNIVNKMKNKNTYYIKQKNEIAVELKGIIKNNDMILVMGAGDINTIIKDIRDMLKHYV